MASSSNSKRTTRRDLESGTSAGTLEKKEWYHGMLPREDIARMLKEQGHFLVRVTEPKKDRGLRKVLSVFWNNKIRHYIIVELSDGSVSIEQLKFASILELIDYYYNSKRPISAKSGAKLLVVAAKQTWELQHDQITLGKVLGEGAFGAVQAGTLQLGTDTIKVAVKVSKCKATNKDMIKDICKEARIMRKYDHPNIVRFYGVAVEKEPIMLVMELVDGGSLDSYLIKHSAGLSTNQRMEMCLDAAKGLEYLHDKGCIHRDVAARNCLVSNGRVKISDFGLSRDRSKDGAEYKITDLKQKLPIRWLAPETLTDASYSAKSDVFSYGILLYEIFTDAAEPYPGMTAAEVNMQVKNGYRMDPPSNMPTAIRAIQHTCFPGNPSERWSMMQVRRALEDSVGKSQSKESETQKPSRIESVGSRYD